MYKFPINRLNVSKNKESEDIPQTLHKLFTTRIRLLHRLFHKGIHAADHLPRVVEHLRGDQVSRYPLNNASDSSGICFILK